MRFAATLTVLASSALAASAQYIDSITMSGKSVDGEVQKETYKEVTIVLKDGGTINADLKQVSDIAWDPTGIPAAFDNAKKLQDARDYKAAIVQWNKCTGNSVRKVLQQHVFFNLAKCQQLDQDFGAATASYQSLLKTYPDSKYLSQIYPGLVECAFHSGKLPDALTVIKEALAKAKELGMDEDFTGDMKLREAMIYERQKQYGPAGGAYQSLISHKTPKIAFSAQVGIGRLAVISKDFDKAKITMEKVIRDCEPAYRMVLAGAYNGLGDYYWSTADKNAANVKEALFCYMRTAVLYLPDSTEPVDEHERGMYMSAKCLKKLAEDAKDAEKDKLMNDFWRMLDRLKATYGSATGYVKDLEKK
jgi:tetratricopeptide (TPR) repeat protein